MNINISLQHIPSPTAATVCEWVQEHPDMAGHVLVLGHTVYTHGMEAYFKDVYQPDQKLQDAVEELRAAVHDADSRVRDEVNSRLEKEARRWKQERELLEQQLAWKTEHVAKAQQQLEEWKESMDARVQDRVDTMASLFEKEKVVAEEYKANYMQALENERRRVEAQKAEYVQSTEAQKVQYEQALERERIALERERQRAEAREKEWLQTLRRKEIEDLKAEIEQREREIHMLKNTNMVKGTVGEAMIAEYLRRQPAFVDAVVEYKGKTPHECDLHMTLASGERFLVESKNKDAISKNDVDKFYADVAGSAENCPCVGAVFVSIRTVNIPHKGSLKFELAHDVPVLFVAFESETHMQEQLGGFVRMFVQYCLIHARTRGEEVQVDTVFHMLNAHFQSLLTQKMCMDRMRTQHKDMAKTLADMERQHQKEMQTIETFLKQHNKMDVNRNYYVCEGCNSYFTNKKVWEQHVGGCGGGGGSSGTNEALPAMELKVDTPPAKVHGRGRPKKSAI